MQDPDIPPQEEGNTNGAVDGVRPDEERVARWAVRARSSKASLPLPWTIATAPIWGWIMAPATTGDSDGQVFRLPIRWWIRSLCQFHEKTQHRASSRLSRTCSS